MDWYFWYWFWFLGFLVFRYQSKLGFEFLEALATKKVLSRYQVMRSGREHFPRWFLVINSLPIKNP
jgi:hypothetical protein